MSDTTLVLNPGGLRVLSMRLLQPYRGVWLADCEIDPDQIALAPSSGKVSLSIGVPPAATLLGTIDPRGSGTFVEFAHLRVLGGGAGWDKPVRPQHYHSDGGLPSTVPISATATEVGEVANVLAPTPLGPDFVRTAGPASRVLEGQTSWWVDIAGVTQVGPRPPVVADPSLTVIRWDPATQVAEFTCDTLVLPGTVLVDPRIGGGQVTARDVEQTFDGRGSHGIAWCAVSSVSQLMNDLRSMVDEFSGRKYLAGYLYRVVLQNSLDGRLQLQAVNPTQGVPDTLPLSPWMGLSGASAKLTPGSLVRVTFLAGDASGPIVDSYQPGQLPIESTVDATAVVHIGPTAPQVELGGATAQPVIPALWGAGLVTALGALATSLSGFGPLAAAGGALATALGALPPGATTKTRAA